MNTLLIYEINTVVWLDELSQTYNQRIDLSNVPEMEIANIAELNFTSVWLMGVWERSPQAILINQQDNNFLSTLSEVVPNFDQQHDIVGSAYSIKGYSVSDRLGGNQALEVFRQNLNKFNLKLLLDFVPNHTSLDHDWAINHPEYYVRANQAEYQKNPNHYKLISGHYIALGRDPNYEPWSDVLQLNANSIALRRAVVQLLSELSTICDGIRCDMANLLLSNIFQSTWGYLDIGQADDEYWRYIIKAVKDINSEFIFIAESYWQTEAQLIDLGFDYCYDKDFYDLMVNNDFDGLSKSLDQPLMQQVTRLHFLENHDEARSAATFSDDYLMNYMVLLLTTPGAKLIYLHQIDGYKIKLPVQIGRFIGEESNDQLARFYKHLLTVIKPILTYLNSNWQFVTSNLDHERLVMTYAVQNLADNQTYLVLINWADHDFDLNIDLDSFSAAKIDSYNCLFSSTVGSLVDDHQVIINTQQLQLKLKPLSSLILTLNS